MGAILAYVIQSALCLALLFIGYCLLGVKRETFHRFNRAVLLGICALAFLLPWGSDMWEGHVAVQSIESDWNAWLAHAAADEEAVPSTPSSRTFPVWQMALLTIYVVGSCVLFVRYLRGWRKLRAVLRNGRCIRLDDKTRLVLHDKEMASFSWMGYVVMSEADYETHGKLILAHELAHVRLRHSWDMLFVSICAVVQWFNPCVWLLRRELQAVHEYEVDEAVLRQGIEERQYQLLLIEKAVGTRRYSMVNSFNHSSLNKRITMMKKKKSSSWACAKYLYVLPLAACAMGTFARPEVSAPLERISSVKITDFTAISETNGAKTDTVAPASVQDDVFDVVEQMPRFPGGEAAMMRFVAKNVKYPTEAHRKGIRGNVVVRFVVQADGTIARAEVVRHADPLLEAEALRVVGLMPRWQPGKQNGKAVAVWSSLPVVFRLDGDATQEKVEENAFVVTAQANAMPDVKSEAAPLFVIDGREASSEDFNALAPADIESITVLKDKSATELYGDKGANGVVLITTKLRTTVCQKMDKDRILILCDGKRITGEELEALSPDKIERVEVMKDSVSKAKYGAADKEGVILVKMK